MALWRSGMHLTFAQLILFVHIQRSISWCIAEILRPFRLVLETLGDYKVPKNVENGSFAL